MVFGKRLQGVAPTLDVRLFGKNKCVILYVPPWFSLYFETIVPTLSCTNEGIISDSYLWDSENLCFVVLITGTSSAPLFSELNSTGTVKLMISI